MNPSNWPLSSGDRVRIAEVAETLISVETHAKTNGEHEQDVHEAVMGEVVRRLHSEEPGTASAVFRAAFARLVERS